MPSYGTALAPPALGTSYPLNQVLVFSAEAVVAGEFSQQFSLPLGPVAGQRGIRVEVDFNNNPGAFEFDVMEADTDPKSAQGANYQQVPNGGAINTVTAGANGPNTHAGSDFIPFAGQFGCIFVKAAPANGNITCTVRVTRAA